METAYGLCGTAGIDAEEDWQASVQCSGQVLGSPAEDGARRPHEAGSGRAPRCPARIGRIHFRNGARIERRAVHRDGLDREYVKDYVDCLDVFTFVRGGGGRCVFWGRAFPLFFARKKGECSIGTGTTLEHRFPKYGA